MLADHRYGQLESLRSALSVLTYPFQVIAEIPSNSSSWLSSTMSSRFDIQAENERLGRELLSLKARLQRFEALEAENLRLRDLLESSYKIGERVLIAELAAVDLDPYKQQVLIKKGSNSGVYEGQPVLDAHAVMGQVIHVNPFSSTVLLITDAQHSLPVQVLRNGLRTIAVGTGQINELELPYLPNNADIKAGDLLVTSGLGGKFPPGYPVASVTSVTRVPGSSFAQIMASPHADLDRSREVLLVWMLEDAIRPVATEAAEPVDTDEKPIEESLE